MSLPGVTPSFEQHHISCISSFSFYGRLLTPLSIQQAERLVRWIFIQISTFSVRFFFLFYSTCDTFCEALLEAEENDCCRDRTDEYAEHQHAIIYSVAAEQVRYQHRHGNGIIVL